MLRSKAWCLAYAQYERDYLHLTHVVGPADKADFEQRL